MIHRLKLIKNDWQINRNNDFGISLFSAYDLRLHVLIKISNGYKICVRTS